MDMDPDAARPITDFVRLTHTHETPFVRFWRAIDDARRLNCRPPLTFGPAHAAWVAAVGEG